jgi:hypothetical protein
VVGSAHAVELGGVGEEDLIAGLLGQMAEGRVDLLADLVSVEADRVGVVGLEVRRELLEEGAGPDLLAASGSG